MNWNLFISGLCFGTSLVHLRQCFWSGFYATFAAGSLNFIVAIARIHSRARGQ